MTSVVEWWKRDVIYQIYPRSFQDSNGDGDGDLPGILQRLDYLQWLGVGAVWVSVFYPSPHVDGGYDVSDYESVDRRYGTLEDLDVLIEEVHRRGMRIVLGLVPNHTSDQHPWFRDSRSSRQSRHAAWYHWHDPEPGGGPPNNWIDALGDGAWTWCEERRQFYYHAYFRQQPDLNWRNPEVREAMYRVMRFWFERGVDGFRIDVLWRLLKDDLLRNDPPNPKYDPASNQPWKRLSSVFSSNQSEVLDVIRKMHDIAQSYGDRALIGEVYVSVPQLARYYENGEGAQLPFNFELILKKWTAGELTESISRYVAELPVGAWPNWVLGNHDQKRVATREGEAGARLGAVLLFTLGGTPFVYNGDEIGMSDGDIPPDAMHDPLAEAGAKFSRDPARTPMQWSPAEGAGFTAGNPWLPVNDDYRERNVEGQRGERGSMLHLYRDLIALRAREEAILSGDFLPLSPQGDLLAYVRRADRTRFLIIANLGHEPQTFEVDVPAGCGTVVIATDRSREGEETARRVVVEGRGAVVIRLE